MKYCPYCLEQIEFGAIECVHCSKKIVYNGTDKELSYYTATVNRLPNNYMTYQSRSSIYTMQGKFDLALSDLNKSLEIKPDNKLVRDRREVILKKQSK